MSDEHKVAFFELPMVLMCVIDVDGHVEDLSSMWRDVLGWSRRVVRGRPFADFVHPDDREGTEAAIARVLEAAAPFEHTHSSSFVCGDGSLRELEWTARAQREEDGVIYVVARDVTDLRRAEARVRALNEELYRLVKERTTELQRVGEELSRLNDIPRDTLRQNLEATTSNLEVLKGRYAGSLDAEGRQFLEEAIAGAGTVRDIVNQLMEYAEVNEAAVERRPVDLHEVVAQIRIQLSAILDSHEAIIGEHPLPTVVGDQRLLRRLFRKLVQHALAFRDVSRPLVTISGREGTSHHVVEFAHNGYGIAQHDRGRAFSFAARLERSDGVMRPAMRLSVCRRIAERLGGSITIDEDDPGGRFLIRLPAAPEGEER